MAITTKIYDRLGVSPEKAVERFHQIIAEYRFQQGGLSQQQKSLFISEEDMPVLLAIDDMLHRLRDGQSKGGSNITNARREANAMKAQQAGKAAAEARKRKKEAAKVSESEPTNGHEGM